MLKASKARGEAAGLGQTGVNFYREESESSGASVGWIEGAEKHAVTNGEGLIHDETEEVGLTVAKDEVVQRPGRPETGESKAQDWLRTLSDVAAKAVYDLMLACFEDKGRIARSHPKLSDSEVEELRTLVASPFNEERDGNWYLRRSECWVLTTTEKGNGHPRWQVKLDGGPSTVGAKLKKLCSESELAALLTLSYPKFQPHHVAFNSKPARAEDPLPVGCGTGSSISHSCDIRGCFQVSHCISAKVHADNMDRQRCSGVILVIYDNLIVTEIPCPHGKQVEQVYGGGLEISILGSCTGIRLHYLARAQGIEIRDKIDREDESFAYF